MANPTAGFGLQVVGRWDGTSPNFSRRKYPILSTYATAIAAGDLVTINATTGNMERYAAGGGSLTIGVVDEFEWYDTAAKITTWSKYWPGPAAAYSGTAWVWVIDDPNAEFIGRVSGTVVTDNNTGENADIVATAPNAAGLSLETINSTTATTATYPLRVLGVYEAVGNDNTLDNNIIRVKLNATVFTTTTGIA